MCCCVFAGVLGCLRGGQTGGAFPQQVTEAFNIRAEDKASYKQATHKIRPPLRLLPSHKPLGEHTHTHAPVGHSKVTVSSCKYLEVSSVVLRTL